MEKRSSKEAVEFCVEHMRQSLFQIASTPFTKMNTDMCIKMRSLARMTLKNCIDALNDSDAKLTGIDGIVPLNTEARPQ